MGKKTHWLILIEHFSAMMDSLNRYLEFLEKLTVDPKYCLLFVDLFMFKVYTYPMKNRKVLSKKMSIIYKYVKVKRKDKKCVFKTTGSFFKIKLNVLKQNKTLKCSPLA